MTAPPTLVAVAPAHAAALAALHCLCFDGQPWHRPWDTAEMAAVLALPGARGWLALADDGAADAPEPVGMILVQVAGPEADILTLGVRAGPWRRRGVGGRLLTRAEADLKSLGVDRLCLEVSGDNSSAICFYRNHGYSVCGRRPGYYGSHAGLAVDALVLARDLPPSPPG
ncbi:GNAT family N-acetyltransferase [Roseospira goensis]|uniref:Ribosomal protein S18 acetylase RimI-like enzyme n=1 Tax=Roseospira goensis TaxID=391922 RepID=A0A7W6S2I4_9PROT|nr:N-acetyltransferase [Roseospira goensis]MBB4287572.1 ribosomal protein S18 acetylase RimI-like enzyme [Roseospira goensis]